MSAETTQAAPHGAHGHDVVHPDSSPIHVGKVILVGALSIATFAVGSVWALRIQSSTERAMNPNGRAAVPAGVFKEENGIVDAAPFELNTWVAKDRAAANAKLHGGYAWVDKKAGLVQVPIERAMELVVAEAATPKVEAPPAPAPPARQAEPKKPAPKKAEKK